MFIGCILSLVIVYFELLKTYPLNSAMKTKKDVEMRLKADFSDLKENTLTKVSIWLLKEKKKAVIFIYPNFFQIISSFF